MPKINPRPLSKGELTNNARRLAAYRAKPLPAKAVNSKHPDGIFLRSKDMWGNKAATVNDIRKEF